VDSKVFHSHAEKTLSAGLPNVLLDPAARILR
jgi:hypothetical protein